MPNNYNDDYFKKRDNLDLLLASTLLDLLKKTNSKKILDVGCGTGKLVKYFQNHGLDAYGVDNSKIALKTASTNKVENLILSPATKLPFKNESFDFLCAISTIEHLAENDSGKFLEEAKRVLKKNGRLFLVTPNFATPIRRFAGSNWFAYKDPTHINFFTPKRLSKLLVKNGFIGLKTRFNVPYDPQIDSGLPSLFKKIPLVFKKPLIYLLFNSPLYIIRDSFWISAQKK